MRKIVFFLLFLFSTSLLLSQNIGDYRSIDGGVDSNWTTVNNWEVYGSSGWMPAKEYPDYYDGVVTIRNFIYVDANITIDQLIIPSMVYLIINPSVTLTFPNGSGNDLYNNGSLKNYGIITLLTGATIYNGADGSYFHMRNGGNIPSMTWSPPDWSAGIVVEGITSSGPTVDAQTDLNEVYWNCSGQSVALTLDADLNPSNLLSISNTGSDIVELNPTGYTCDIIQSVGTYVKLVGNTSLATGRTYTNNGTLEFQSNNLNGNANFILSDDATIKIGHVAGLNECIKVTGNINLGNSNYIYNTAGYQIDGSLLPMTGIKKLEKNPAGFLEITVDSVIIYSELKLTTSSLWIGEKRHIELGPDAVITLNSPSTNNMIWLEPTSFLRKVFDNNQTFLFPIGPPKVGMGDVTYSPVSMTTSATVIGSYIDVYCVGEAYNNPGWTDYLDKYWFLQRTGDFQYVAYFNYLDQDIVGDENKFAFGRNDGTKWSYDDGEIDININQFRTQNMIGDYYYSAIPQKGVILDLKVFLQGAYR